MRWALAALCAAPVQALCPFGAARAEIIITPGDQTSTLDETPGLQTQATADKGNDVASSSLPQPFKDRLTALGVDFSSASSHPFKVGVAESPAELIEVVSDGPLDSLGLTDADGNPFDGDPAGDDIETLDGASVFLWSDSDNRIVLGRRPGVDGAVVFAVYMQTTVDAEGATDVKLWTLTTEALRHPSALSPDDAVDIFENVHLTAMASLTFDFNDLPSGQNLFGIVGPSKDDPAIAVIGRLPDLNPDGTYTNTSDTINTSQGGGPTTIGVNNQMFDEPDEGAYFTYINKPVQAYLAGAPGGLTQNEADDADNIQYTGGLVEAGGGFCQISQIQGGGPASVKISAFNRTGAPQGQMFVTTLDDGAPVSSTTVRVYAGVGGTLLEDTGDPTVNDPDITVEFESGGVAIVHGLQAGHVIEWETDGLHDHVLVQNAGGKFDIGRFGVNQADRASESLAGLLFVDDDGPTIGAIEDGVVPFVEGESVANDVVGAVGTDIPGGYEITDCTESLDIHGVTVITDCPGTTVNYFEDKNGNEVYDPGDQLYFTLELGLVAEILKYTFTVVYAPPAPPLNFDFNDLPSGQNLFGMVGEGDNLPALIVIGENPVIDSNGKYTNASDTINTSKGGGPTTIGVNNQMFDEPPEEGAYFTYVKDPDTGFLAGAPNGLTQGEADYADNILYDGGLIEVDSAFVQISQLQGNELVTARVTAFDLDEDYQGREFVHNLGAEGGMFVDITLVRVYDASGTLVEEDTLEGAPTKDDPGIVVDYGVDGVEVSGLGAGYRVEWVTDELHDQALVQVVDGKFDVGLFGFNQPQPTPDQLLEFTVTLTDEDLDPDESSFSICVDGDDDDDACA